MPRSPYLVGVGGSQSAVSPATELRRQIGARMAQRRAITVAAIRRGEVPPDLGDITETDPTKLARELHATAVAIGQGRDRNDVAGVAALLAHFRDVAEAYRRTGAGDMASIDRVIVATGDWVAAAVRAAPDAIAALPRAIGLGLLKGALPFVALAGLWFYISGKAGRGASTWH